MSAEVVQLVEQAGPYLTTAVSAYGVAVFSRAESAAVDGTAHLGRRILQAVWRRRDEQGPVELAGMLPAAGEAVNVTASGERSIAAKTIVRAVIGDYATIRP